jgi:hypothetical protein
MSSPSIAMLRPRARVKVGALTPAQARERWAVRKVGTAWGLLFLNVLTFAPHVSVLPIPSSMGKVITQGALPVALLVALTANRKLMIRPSIFLCLVSLLGIEAILTVMSAQYLRSTAYRTFRLEEFVATLWLLSPYFGRRDMLLVRCHLKTMLVLLGSVLLGLMIAPGRALNGGRLGGAIWPIPSTQVAHYAAVTLGMVLVLWFCGRMGGRAAAVIIVLSVIILLLTHTRTALVGALGGILIGGLSLIVSTRRVSKFFTIALGIVAVAVLTSSAAITNWLARGQGTSQLTGLSGRTSFWGPLLDFPRNKFQEIFGFGLSNDTFSGLPIDSNWFDSYQNQGLFGVVVCALILIFLYVAAGFHPRGVQRALALFLTTYCLIASFTEIGFTSASPYMLDVAVAASLLVPIVFNREQAEELTPLQLAPGRRDLRAMAVSAYHG